MTVLGPNDPRAVRKPRPDALVAAGLEALGPMTLAEFRLIADAVREIEVRRLVDGGLARKEAESVSALMDDFFAFEAAAQRR
jgi:hypothetical protein